MRPFFLLVSFLWASTDVYKTFAIPLQDTVQIHREPIGFNTPSHREKRSEKGNVSCSIYDYQPRRKNYCCQKCPTGCRVEEHCSGAGQSPRCVQCEKGTYADIPNNTKYCEACTTCLTQYNQITVSECRAERNTECGCPEGYFKEISGTEFICRECTTCRNGTQAYKCHDDKDTVCQCFHNFFFHFAEKKCLPCSECEEEHCKDHCPDPKATRIPEESESVLWISLGAAALVAIVFIAFGVYIYYTRNHSSSPNSSTDSICPAPLLRKDDKDSNSKEEEKVFIVGNSPQSLLLNGSLPLPDITNVPSPPSLNTPKVIYAIIDSIPLRRWGEFVRRLGLSDHIIETSEKDHRHFSDAQYAMLQVWLMRDGCSTTKRDQLFNVLRDINLGGCIDKIEEHL